MIYNKMIEGRYVDLISCTEEDAEFTCDIRKDPEFVKYLPKIDNTVDEQRIWIRNQRKKEGDYFFVVWNKRKERIGTISIYDINGERAEGGRLAIKSNNPFHALEAQILSFEFGFGVLGLKCIVGFIYDDNERGLRFNKMFGGKLCSQITGRDGRNMIVSEIWDVDFYSAENKIKKIIYR